MHWLATCLDSATLMSRRKALDFETLLWSNALDIYSIEIVNNCRLGAMKRRKQ